MTKADLLGGTAKQMMLFEKEKGGTGSTGTLVTMAHVVREQGIPRVFIECSLSQNDVYNAYSANDTVYRIDLTKSDAPDLFLAAIMAAPPRAVILANIPGGRIETLKGVHRLIDYVQRRQPDAAPRVSVVWTMGLDAASRTTLDALLDDGIPGRLLLNCPEWWAKDVHAFQNVDRDLLERVRDTGGEVFQTKAMPAHLYNLFRSHEIAIERLVDVEGFDFSNQMALELWAQDAAASVGELLR